MTGTPRITGWHPDPLDEAQLRYWDGEKWGKETTPAPGNRQPGQVATAGNARPQRSWTVNWASAFSFRVIFGAGFVAILVGILPSLISPAFGGVVMVLVFVLVYGLAVFNPNAAVLYCPHCRKRIKVGADTCHHCGRTVAA